MNGAKNYRSAFIIVTVLFFLWGFITVLVDSLIPRLKDVFELSNFQSGLVQFAFFIAFFVFSLPAGALLSKIGYKKGIILGLLIMATGCLLFYPAATNRLFWVFLLGYFTLAAGITVLQVAANPYVAVLGPENEASSRLNLSQAFNSLGTTLAPIIGALFLLSDTIMSSKDIGLLSENDKLEYYLQEASAVQKPFLILAALIAFLALIFVFIKLPKLLKENRSGGYTTLLKNKMAVLGFIGIFLYVGAEVAIGSYLVLYFMDMNLAPIIASNGPMMQIASGVSGIFNLEISQQDPKSLVGIFVIFYWGGAMVGRFIGAYLTKIMAPSKVLSVFAFIACLLIVISMSTSGLVAMWTILMVGLFNSIMFPTIFTLTLEGLDNLKPQASGLLCMAIVGGAFIPPLYGLLTDWTDFKAALVLLLICYAYIIYFGFKKRIIKVL